MKKKHFLNNIPIIKGYHLIRVYEIYLSLYHAFLAINSNFLIVASFRVIMRISIGYSRLDSYYWLYKIVFYSMHQHFRLCSHKYSEESLYILKAIKIYVKMSVI